MSEEDRWYYGKGGHTILTVACRAMNVDVVRVLLERGEDVNAHVNGDTPLTLTVENARFSESSLVAGLEIARLLIDHGADIDALGQSGSSALFLATVYKMPTFVQLLISRGANVNLATVDGFTPLSSAVQVRAGKQIVKMLEDADADQSTKPTEVPPKPTWNASSRPKLVIGDHYEEMASTFQCLEVGRLNEIMKRNGIDDRKVRRAICEEYLFESSIFLEAGWLKAGDRIVSPELCFVTRSVERKGSASVRELHVVSPSFLFHEYAFGNAGWYFDDHNEDATEIENGCG